MKTLLPALLLLLVSALSLPSMAQSFEEQMRQAAGAYERKDMATAARIWKVWAAKGDPEAQTLLGAMYWSGEGVTRNLNEAARLYLAAAKQGYARAQNNIGFMLGFGEGVPPRDDVEAYNLEKIGPMLEAHPIFPEKANISLAHVVARDHIILKVWERGVGLTRACGTAACAAVVAASRKKLTERKARVTLPGGDLLIEWRKNDDHVIMTGPVELEFEGRLSPDLFAGLAA